MCKLSSLLHRLKPIEPLRVGFVVEDQRAVVADRERPLLRVRPVGEVGRREHLHGHAVGVHEREQCDDRLATCVDGKNKTYNWEKKGFHYEPNVLKRKYTVGMVTDGTTGVCLWDIILALTSFEQSGLSLEPSGDWFYELGPYDLQVDQQNPPTAGFYTQSYGGFSQYGARSNYEVHINLEHPNGHNGSQFSWTAGDYAVEKDRYGVRVRTTEPYTAHTNVLIGVTDGSGAGFGHVTWVLGGKVFIHIDGDTIKLAITTCD